MLVREDGSIQTLGDPPPEIASLGTVKRKRISHIRPVQQPKRAAFIALRWLFGDRGKVAAWTRTWQCRWEVQFIGMAERCVFKSRTNAVGWEYLMAERMMVHNLHDQPPHVRPPKAHLRPTSKSPIRWS